MKAYIAISFSKKELMRNEIAAILAALNNFHIATTIFVNQYKFAKKEEQEMMKQAMLDIDDCDLFIAEASQKAIGVGIEAGYAKAKGKTLFYVRHKSSEHSTTLSGISDYSILYSNVDDLKQQLIEVIKENCAS